MSTTPNTSVTKAESTKQQYEKNHRKLERMARSRYNIAADKDVSAQQVAALFLDMEAGWAASTARLYRASLSHVFDNLNNTASTEAREMIYRATEEPERLAEVREAIRAERKKRKRNQPCTSAQKAKSLPEPDRARLNARLDQSRSEYARSTKRWFEASVLTGLRPTEWQHALLTTDAAGQTILVIKNAKTSNGRGHGPERTIELGNFTASEIAVVTEHLGTVRKWINEKSFERRYGSCRRLLRNIARKLWPRRRKYPTLYTGRHIFAANAKVDHGPIAVAALMGHASTETAYAHYGKRYTGTGGMAAMPNASDMDAVARRNPVLMIAKRQAPVI